MFVFSHLRQLSLAIPSWVGVKVMVVSFGHNHGRKQRVLRSSKAPSIGTLAYWPSRLQALVVNRISYGRRGWHAGLILIVFLNPSRLLSATNDMSCHTMDLNCLWDMFLFQLYGILQLATWCTCICIAYNILICASFISSKLTYAVRSPAAVGYCNIHLFCCMMDVCIHRRLRPMSRKTVVAGLVARLVARPPTSLNKSPSNRVEQQKSATKVSYDISLKSPLLDAENWLWWFSMWDWSVMMKMVCFMVGNHVDGLVLSSDSRTGPGQTSSGRHGRCRQRERARFACYEHGLKLR